MKDFFGFELAVGDQVAMSQPGYKSLIPGTIVKINPKMVRVAYESRGYNDLQVTNKYPTDVVKKLADPDTWKLMKFTAGMDE